MAEKISLNNVLKVNLTVFCDDDGAPVPPRLQVERDAGILLCELHDVSLDEVSHSLTRRTLLAKLKRIH